MEFSKKIVVWGILYVTLSTILYTIIYLVKGDVSSELIGLSGAVITGVIVSYSAKAGVENYQKIKNEGNQASCQEENGV